MPQDERMPAAPVGVTRYQERAPESPPVKMEAVKSSNLLERGYDPGKRELHVKFGTRKGDEVFGAKTYVHSNVSPEQWAHFIAAESAGKHYASTFRGNDKHPHRILPEPK